MQSLFRKLDSQSRIQAEMHAVGVRLLGWRIVKWSSGVVGLGL
jgi:hypothetical protein